MVKEISVGNLKVGGDNPLVLIAGPCVIEGIEICLEIANGVKGICDDLGFPFIFKSSYDKANRMSMDSYRGPGLEEGLKILGKIKEELAIPVLTDVHCVTQVKKVAKVVDVLQIPAFLCRQTDLVVAAAETGKPLNLKKGQFMAAWDMGPIIEKATRTGNDKVMVTERGTSFGYNNLVVDMRSLAILRRFGYPLVFDGTHSVQLPGGLGAASGGQREFVRPLVKAAVAVGVDAIYLEVHPEPDKALCDGPNMVKLMDLPAILAEVRAIDEVVKSTT